MRIKSGQVSLQKHFAIVFKTKSRDEFTHWVKALRNNGILRGHTHRHSSAASAPPTYRRLQKMLTPNYVRSHHSDRFYEEPLEEIDEEEKSNEFSTTIPSNPPETLQLNLS